MTDSQIHSCSYFCDKPACIKRQRDELRDKLYAAQPVTQPLTDEQLFKLLKRVDGQTKRLSHGFKLFARAIEAAHGITPAGDKA